jgi:hypothetical protein
MAELLLMANPAGVRASEDEGSLSIDFDTIAELRSWLDASGLNAPDLLTGEREGTLPDGRPYRAMNAYPTWHGWEIFANAVEMTEPATPLDPQTADQLTALAVAA